MVKMVNFIVYLTTINYGRIKKKLKDLKQPFNYAHRFRGEGSESGARHSGEGSSLLHMVAWIHGEMARKAGPPSLHMASHPQQIWP